MIIGFQFLFSVIYFKLWCYIDINTVVFALVSWALGKEVVGSLHFDGC